MKPSYIDASSCSCYFNMLYLGPSEMNLGKTINFTLQSTGRTFYHTSLLMNLHEVSSSLAQNP